MRQKWCLLSPGFHLQENAGNKQAYQKHTIKKLKIIISEANKWGTVTENSGHLILLDRIWKHPF
jgi:hypothetical protein